VVVLVVLLEHRALMVEQVQQVEQVPMLLDKAEEEAVVVMVEVQMQMQEQAEQAELLLVEVAEVELTIAALSALEQEAMVEMGRLEFGCLDNYE
jgi:hypothetical protein